MPSLQLVVLAAVLAAAVRGSPAILGSGAADGPRSNKPTGDILDHDPAFLATALALVGHALSEQLAAESTQAPETTTPRQTEATNAAIAGDGLSLAANLVAALGESAFPEQQPIGQGLAFTSDLVSSVGQGISPTVATPVGDGRQANSEVTNVNNFQPQPASLSSGLRSPPSLPARPAVPAVVPTEQPAPAAHIPAAPIQKSVPTLGPQHSAGQEVTAAPSTGPAQQASAISFPSFEQFLSSLGSTTSPPSPAVQEQTEAPAVNVEPNSNTAPLEPQPVVEQPVSEAGNSLSAESSVPLAAFHPAASLFGLFGGLPQLWNQATLNPFAATVHHPFAAAVQNPFASAVQNPFAAAVPLPATGPSPLSAAVQSPFAATGVNPFAAAVPNSLDVAGSNPVPQTAPTGLNEAQTVAIDPAPISVTSTTPQVPVSPLPGFSQTVGQSVTSEVPFGNAALGPAVPEVATPVVQSIAPVQENTFTQSSQVTAPATLDTPATSSSQSAVTADAPAPQTEAVAVNGPAVAADGPSDADSELAFDVAAVLAAAQLGAQLATEHHEAARAAAEAQLAVLQATTLETGEPSENEGVAPGETQQADQNSETGDNPVEQQPIEAVEQQGATEQTVVEQNEVHNVPHAAPQSDDDDASEAQPPSSSQVVAVSSAPRSEQVTTPQEAVEGPVATQVEPEQPSVTNSEETLNQNTEQTTTEQAAADVHLATNEAQDTPLADGTTTEPDSGIVTGESQTAGSTDTAPVNEPVPVEEPLPKHQETGHVLIASNEPTETPAGSPEITTPGSELLITEPEHTQAPQPDDDESKAQTSSSVLEEEQLILPVAAEPEAQPVESQTTPAPVDVPSVREGAAGHSGDGAVEAPQSAVADGGDTTDSGRHVSSQELSEIRRVLGSQPRPTKRPQITKSSGLGKLTVVRPSSRLYSRRGKSGRRTFKKFRLVPRRSFTGSEGSSRLPGGRRGAADRPTLSLTDDSEVSQSGPVSRFGQRISGPKKVKSYANFYLWQGTAKPEEMPIPVNRNRNRGRSSDRNGGNFVDRRGGRDRSGPFGFTDVYGPRFNKYGTPNSRGGNGDRRVFSYNRGFNTRRGFVGF